MPRSSIKRGMMNIGQDPDQGPPKALQVDLNKRRTHCIPADPANGNADSHSSHSSHLFQICQSKHQVGVLSETSSEENSRNQPQERQTKPSWKDWRIPELTGWSKDYNFCANFSKIPWLNSCLPYIAPCSLEDQHHPGAPIAGRIARVSRATW